MVEFRDFVLQACPTLTQPPYESTYLLAIFVGAFENGTA